jgi:hypothetical protein
VVEFVSDYEIVAQITLPKEIGMRWKCIRRLENENGKRLQCGRLPSYQGVLLRSMPVPPFLTAPADRQM